MVQTPLQADYYSTQSLNVDESLISSEAISAVRTLTRAGYSCYLVGGCIRDLLLGVTPKDFDISTNASPNQIKNIFPKSRIIGQRFKIVHVMMRGELLEIATFRKAVKDHHKNSQTGQVLDDNVFGTLEDDASRRDFTVNALYYDVNKKQVIDYFNGINDLKQQKLKLIGDPEVRFAEDPGRILRTVRFQAKFGFDVSEQLTQAVFTQKHSLQNVPPARRFDELLKLFYCGEAERVWQLFNEYQLLPYLFAYTEDAETKLAKLSKSMTQLALARTDQRVRENKPVISSFMFCAILWPFYHDEFQNLLNKKHPPNLAMEKASEIVISRQLLNTGMLRRVSNTIRDIWWLQYRLEKARPRSLAKIISNPRFRAAYDFLLIRSECGDAQVELADFWTKEQTLKKYQVSLRNKKKETNSKLNTRWNKRRGKR